MAPFCVEGFMKSAKISSCVKIWVIVVAYVVWKY